MISVIVPVYNVEKYISRCIDSIIAQAYKDWELILVDDGTPDNSGKICDEYALQDSRIRVFHKENGGVSTARNLGLYNAKGEWVTFVDSDDWVESDWLESVHQKMQSKEADLYTWGNTRDLPNGLISSTYKPEEKTYNRSINFICSNNYKYYMWLYLFKRKWIELYNCRCPEGIRRSEDQYFNLQYICHNPKIVTISRAFYHYVDNSDSCINQKVDAYDLVDNLKVAVLLAEYGEKYKDVDFRFIKESTYSLFFHYIEYIQRNGLLGDKQAKELYNKYFSLLKRCDKRLVNDIGLFATNYSLKCGYFILNHANGIKSRLNIS